MCRIWFLYMLCGVMCLKYSEIIKISAISLDTRYKLDTWNYGFAFRGAQGGEGGLP